MKLLVCVEDRCGMLFNGRRESRDRLVTLDMLVEAGAGKLYIQPFSEKLFRGNRESVHVVEDIFAEAPGEATAFVEDVDLTGREEEIETLVVYRWNRVYPYDLTMNVDLTRYELTQSLDFTGYSHDCITKNVFTRIDGSGDKASSDNPEKETV